ncbi:MAG: hypothetical protein E7446_01675 [Ruminococcaceae bacterium]|nr:hypothetical protein [Oscillospiraceae bacterium]
MKKKTLLSVVYAGYVLFCLAACLLADRIYLAEWFKTLNDMSVGYTWFPQGNLALFILGALWVGEHWLATQVNKPVLITMRIFSLLVMALWMLEILLIYIPPKIISLEWAAPTRALPALMGMQIASTVFLLVRKSPNNEK